MKSKEELNKLKEEVEAVNEKLAELTEEEIAQVSGGLVSSGLVSGGAHILASRVIVTAGCEADDYR